MKTKTQRWKKGAVVEIPLQDHNRGFGVLQTFPRVVVLDLVSNCDLPIGEVSKANILFKADIEKFVISKSVWPVIGVVELSGKFEGIEPVLFVQSQGSGEVFLYHSKYADQGYMKSCPIEAIAGLERAAVADDAHIKGRLNAHFYGCIDPWADELAVDIVGYEKFLATRRKN